MIGRTPWLERIGAAWSRRTVVWLSGVRRVGKTTLARMLPDAVYLSCDLPSVERTLADPELFLDGQAPGSTLIFDEVHRLAEATAIEAFRELYPAGDNYIASPGATRPYRTRRGGHVLTVCSPAGVC